MQKFRKYIYPLLIILLWATAFFGKMFLPQDLFTVELYMASIEKWIYKHADYPLLFSFIAGLFISTVFVPNILRLLHYYLERDDRRFAIVITKTIEGVIGKNNTPNTPIYSLEIKFGIGNNYEKTTPHKNSLINKIISVCVVNTGNKLISNCRLYLEINETNGRNISQTIAEGFTLVPEEQKYIELAEYNEEIHYTGNSIQSILLSKYNRAMLSYSDYISNKEKYHITLRVLSLEAPPYEIAGILWVRPTFQRILSTNSSWIFFQIPCFLHAIK